MEIYELMNIKTSNFCKGKTPLKASKKFWRKFKHLQLIQIRNTFTKEEYIFNSKDWIMKGSSKKFKQ